MLNVIRLSWHLPGALLLGGALHALSFAPGPLPAWVLSPLQLIVMAWLVRTLWLAPTARQAATRAWLFGMGNFMIGLYWLTISMHTYVSSPYRSQSLRPQVYQPISPCLARLPRGSPTESAVQPGQTGTQVPEALYGSH